jgi:polyphosphate glucokinase
MLFLGLGTGLGATLVASEVILPLEVAHMPFRDGMSYEDFVGKRGYERMGKQAWRNAVIEVAAILRAGLIADYVVFGGGNAKRMKEIPDWCRLGANENAFKGGANMWQHDDLRLL